MAPQQICVAALGVGNVGSNFLSQLSNLSLRLSKYSGASVSVSLIFVGNSRRSLYSSTYTPLSLSHQSWSVQLQDSADGSGTHSLPALSMSDLVTYLARAPGTPVLVDNSASQSVADAYPEFLRRGVSIVASNKKAFSSSYNLFDAIYRAAANNLFRPGQEGLYPTIPGGDSEREPGYVFHESSVGAGLPIISTVKDLVETGDRVTRIEGIFSGTMSYLFNQFNPVSDASSSLPFSRAVTKAKEEGFTEPDARDDLNGLDVARKLVILARLCGWKLETSNIPIQNLVPDPLRACQSGEEFLKELPQFDEQMDELKAEAAGEGKVLRYVGSLDFVKQSARVGMEKFEKSHPIAGIKGSDNIISFFTERYGSQPLIVQGAGAGGAVTAMGVTADVLKVIRVSKHRRH